MPVRIEFIPNKIKDLTAVDLHTSCRINTRAIYTWNKKRELNRINIP